MSNSTLRPVTHHWPRGLQDINYFATITLNEGKVYALFVKSPARVRALLRTTLLVGTCAKRQC